MPIVRAAAAVTGIVHGSTAENPDGISVSDVSRKHMSAMERFEASRPHEDDFQEPVRSFIIFGDVLFKLANSVLFESLIMLCIVVSSLAQALNTYDDWKESHVLDVTETILLVIFTIELAMKILSESVNPWR